jgi:hypothetical protein
VEERGYSRRKDRQELEASRFRTVQHDQTRPHWLKRLAKLAARAGVRHGKDQSLPLLPSVEARERAALVARSGSALADMHEQAGQVTDADADFTRATADHKDATASRAAAEKDMPTKPSVESRPALELPRPAPEPEQSHRLIGPVLEWSGLLGVSGMDIAFNYMAAQVMAMPSSGRLWVAIGAAAWILALSLFVGRGFAAHAREQGVPRHRLLAVGIGFVSGVAGMVAFAEMREAYQRAQYAMLETQTAAFHIDQRWLPWLVVFTVAAFVGATCLAYAGASDDPQAARQWRKDLMWALVDYYQRLRRHRKQQREQQGKWTERQAELDQLRQKEAAAADRETEAAARFGRAAQALRMAMANVLMVYRMQAADGDARQYDVNEHLVEEWERRRRGFFRRFKGFWRGSEAVPLEPLPEVHSLATEDVEQFLITQVKQVAGSAMEVLKRRGLATDSEPLPSLAPLEADIERPRVTLERTDNGPAGSNASLVPFTEVLAIFQQREVDGGETLTGPEFAKAAAARGIKLPDRDARRLLTLMRQQPAANGTSNGHTALKEDDA